MFLRLKVDFLLLCQICFKLSLNKSSHCSIRPEYGGIPHIASKVVAVLGSVEEITKSISTEEASVFFDNSFCSSSTTYVTKEY